MVKCSICDREAFYKIKGENLFYCRDHAREFFSLSDLEKVDKITISAKQAEILKRFLEK